MTFTQLLFIIFLILWIIIGVGAIFVLLRFHWLVKRLEKIISSLMDSVTELSGIFKSVSINKEVIIGGITFLTILKKLFGRRETTKK